MKKTKQRKSLAQMAGIMEPDHKYGYTPEAINTIFSTKERKKFDDWMAGQTCMVDEKTKNIICYTCDVTRFVNMIRHKIATYWD